MTRNRIKQFRPGKHIDVRPRGKGWVVTENGKGVTPARRAAILAYLAPFMATDSPKWTGPKHFRVKSPERRPDCRGRITIDAKGVIRVHVPLSDPLKDFRR